MLIDTEKKNIFGYKVYNWAPSLWPTYAHTMWAGIAQDTAELLQHRYYTVYDCSDMSFV